MATLQVSKEYVRGQLLSMGIENISEEDLDAYTRGKEDIYDSNNLSQSVTVIISISDFSRLVEGHLEHEQSTSSVAAEAMPRVSSSHPLMHRPSATSLSAQHTPVNPVTNVQQQPGSAVFKVS